MDFLQYDGKSDPLIFINRCESYFYQQRIMEEEKQRIMEEEKVWIASYNLEEGAQMWYIQIQQTMTIKQALAIQSSNLIVTVDCLYT